MKFLSIGLFVASVAIDRSHAFSAPAVSANANAFSSLPALADFDYNQNARLPYLEEGYGKWAWKGHEINYLELGDPSNPPLLLIHGFGGRFWQTFSLLALWSV